MTVVCKDILGATPIYMPRNPSASSILRYAVRLRPLGRDCLRGPDPVGVNDVPLIKDMYAVYSRNGPTRTPGKYSLQESSARAVSGNERLLRET